jgi:predicted nuclease of restriction endonuclease-like RecB superfamily
MSQMQEIEINRYYNRIVKNMSHLIERYREIMAWDIPENDPVEADKLIFKAIHNALEELEKASKSF